MNDTKGRFVLDGVGLASLNLKVDVCSEANRVMVFTSKVWSPDLPGGPVVDDSSGVELTRAMDSTYGENRKWIAEVLPRDARRVTAVMAIWPLSGTDSDP